MKKLIYKQKNNYFVFSDIIPFRKNRKNPIIMTKPTYEHDKYDYVSLQTAKLFFSLYNKPIKELLSNTDNSLEVAELITDAKSLLKEASDNYVPFDCQKDNYNDLRDRVDEYKNLLELVSVYGLDWDPKYYRPQELKQQIMDYELTAQRDQTREKWEFILGKGI